MLDDPETNVQRMALRVKKGGHAVDPEKIRERYWRSLQQMPWFLENADRAWIYDNSGAEPRLICEKQDDEIELFPTRIDHVRLAILSLAEEPR